MLETTISGLIIAAIGGISWLAYQQPAAYRKIHYPITWLMTGVLVILAIFNSGASYAYGEFLPFIQTDKYTEARSVTANLQNLSWWLFLGFVAAQIYLAFLRYLPELMRQGNEQPPPNKDSITDEK